jgi:hypothetical protein
MIGNIRKSIVAIAIAALIIVQFVGKSAATASPASAPAFVDADLSAESRSLDTYVDELAQFDKKGKDLAKKPSLTRTEFATYERRAEDLKRRLSGVQNTLIQIITKLKAAGQWDNLDQSVLAKISDSRFQDFVRREGFKKVLEEAASVLSNSANEIVSPVEILRNKVHAQAPDFEPGNSILASRAVRVAYTTMFTKPVRCALAYIRVGITRRPLGSGKPSKGANDAFNCYCLDFNCEAL